MFDTYQPDVETAKCPCCKAPLEVSDFTIDFENELPDDAYVGQCPTFNCYRNGGVKRANRTGLLQLMLVTVEKVHDAWGPDEVDGYVETAVPLAFVDENGQIERVR